jgi:hypothetical protein
MLQMLTVVLNALIARLQTFYIHVLMFFFGDGTNAEVKFEAWDPVLLFKASEECSWRSLSPSTDFVHWALRIGFVFVPGEDDISAGLEHLPDNNRKHVQHPL